MELCLCYTLWSLICIFPIIIILVHQRQISAASRLPPSPPGWPIFGNMFQLGTMPYHTLAGVRDKYGPVVWLRLGSISTLMDYERNGKDEPDKISDHNIHIFILELFLAGTETTSSTTEWAMTELLCNPEALSKVKDELNKVVGPNRKLEGTDIDNLPYLQGVVRETMRLHPPIPLLLPRRSMHDTEYMGYHIPTGTQLFMNAWAIGRDPEVWDEPNSFKPERFIGSSIDYKGQYYELIPFGTGCRMCEGVPLGHRMLNLLLGSLLHEFDWKLPDGVTPENMDREKRLGATVRKPYPLMAIAKKIKIIN